MRARQLDEEAWSGVWAEGKAMRLERAFEYALSEEERSHAVAPTAAAPSAQRTAREASPVAREEVAELVARGLTNRQIATELSHLRAHGRHPRQKDPQEAGTQFQRRILLLITVAAMMAVMLAAMADSAAATKPVVDEKASRPGTSADRGVRRLPGSRRFRTELHRETDL